MTKSERRTLEAGLGSNQAAFNVSDYRLKPDWKHSRSKTGGYGLCTATCHNCFHRGHSNHKQKWMCLVPPWALMFAVAGLQQGAPPVPLGKNLSTMLLCTLIMQVVAWYLSNVLPSNFGTRKPWNFFLFPRYWGIDKLRRRCLGRSASPNRPVAIVDASDEDDGTFLSSARAVVVRQLTKVFGPAKTRPAVDHASFEIQNGEIFALLGHNGAGKTTTISMLTGMLEPTSGDFFVHGCRGRDGMEDIFKVMGFCPQHNVMFDHLTAAEHVEMFARLKGAPSREAAEQERRAILEAFELTERADFFVSALSGGMRRKVCVAMALTGDTKFVVLDEPTAGLDPGARRRLWQTLAALKKGRSMLLTTHYMDEAEVLADRMAIMKDGKVE